MKISGNSFCPCGSQKKFKNCCRIFHYGEDAKNALQLMKSRYSAYVASDSKYIIQTTHRDNPSFTHDHATWEKEIHDFFDHSDFKNLEIIDFIDGETEAYVTFRATIYQGAIDISFTEKSTFLKVNGKWLYYNGQFIQ